MRRGATKKQAISAAEWVNIDALKPWPGNPRRNAKAVAAVRASLDRFGWGAPIVARREGGEVVAGHTRLLAARERGDERVPVRWVDLSEEEAHALSLADNKLGELAEWDTGAFEDLLEKDGLDLASLGWSELEVAELSAQLEPEDRTSGEPDRDVAIKKRRLVLEWFVVVEESTDIERAMDEAMFDAATRGAALARICREWMERRDA